MYAAGEAMYSTAAFLVVALVPTLLALWFLRHHEGFWNTMSVASLAFAAVGLVAVFSPLLFPTTPRHIGSLVVQLLRLAQLLGVASVVPGLRALRVHGADPGVASRAGRRTAIELVIGVCALVHWIVPAHESELPEHGQLAARSDPVLLHLHEIDPRRNPPTGTVLPSHRTGYVPGAVGRSEKDRMSAPDTEKTRTRRIRRSRRSRKSGSPGGTDWKR